MLTCTAEEQRGAGIGGRTGTMVLHSAANDGEEEQMLEEEEAAAAASLFRERIEDANEANSSSLVDKAKKEFHSKRFLKMKHLQSDITEQDIRQLLSPFDIKDVQLNRVSETAKVTLMTPECLEAWPMEKTYVLNHQLVPVAPSNTEGMLCVAQLPQGYTDLEFRNLVQMFGRVSRCFLMRAEKTGDSKGYGFVEYSSKDVAYQVKGLLDKKTIGDSVLHCNWLDSSYVTYRSLHSKCLYVDRLPPDYRDLVEFRQLFSSVVSPSYCQIAMWNGRPLGFGLVEFNSPEDAEEIQCLMNNYQLKDHKIRVTFCIPGYRAMVIYNKLTAVNNVTAGGKGPLLPNPPVDPNAFDQLQSLATQNPNFLQTLQNISNGQFSRELSNSGSIFGNGVGGKGSQSPPGHQQTTCGQNLQESTLGSNPNISAALVLLLATQLQSQMGVQQPSLLGNPQLLTLVQNILKQQEPVAQSTNAFNCQPQSSPQTSPKSNCSNSSWNSNDAAASSSSSSLGHSNGYQSGGQVHLPRSNAGYKVPLLPDPPSSCKTNVGLLPRPNCYSLNEQVSSTVTPCALSGSHSSSSSADGTSHLLNYKNRNTNVKSVFVSSSSNGHAKVPLLGDKPPSFIANRNGPQCETLVPPPLPPPCPDVNALKQLLPLLVSQLQQQQQHSSFPAVVQSDARSVASNLMFAPPSGCQPSPSNVATAVASSAPVSQQHMQGASGSSSFMHLVLQMAGCLNAGMGSSGCDSSLGKHSSSNLFFPQQLPNPFLSGRPVFPSSPPFISAAASGGAKFSVLPPTGGFSTLGSLPPPPPLPPVKKHCILNPVFPSPTSCGAIPVLPAASPMVVSKLVAEIQQRGSVLGDFWQVNSGAKRGLHVVFPSSDVGILKRRRF